MNKAIGGIAILLVISGCATGYRPMVDMRGVDKQAYDADLQWCQDKTSEALQGNTPTMGTTGIAQRRMAERGIIRECMKKKGYTVLS